MRRRALSLAALASLVVAATGFGPMTTPASAQNLEAGKSPAQIFSTTCAVCHKSARGLVKTVPGGSLPGFLRQHYTTSNEMASVMAAYVMGSGGTDRVAEPPAKREPKQNAAQTPLTPEQEAERQKALQERRERAKERQKAAKKGKQEPAETAKPADTKPVETKPAEPPAEVAKPEPPVAVPPPAAVETKPEPAPVAEPAKPAEPPAETKPKGIVLPGFPLPEGESATEPAETAPATPATAAPAPAAAAPAAAEPAPAASDTPKTEIMQEEVHTPRANTPIAPRKKKE